MGVKLTLIIENMIIFYMFYNIFFFPTIHTNFALLLQLYKYTDYLYVSLNIDLNIY